MLDLNWRRLALRVPVDLPQDVQPPTRRLEARRVDHAAVREVADERLRVGREGPRGRRRGRDADAVVVTRAVLAMRGVCRRTREKSGHPGGRAQLCGTAAVLTVHDVVAGRDLADVGGPDGTA